MGKSRWETSKEEFSRFAEAILRATYWEMIGLVSEKEAEAMNEKFWRNKLLGESAV